MTHKDTDIEQRIDDAAERIGSVWPLHSFVTANPLSGFEDRPFHEAVAEAEQLFGGRGYPHPSVFRQAWERGQIDDEILHAELDANGVDADPETLLDEMAATESDDADPDADSATAELDRVLSKWLAAFLDHGTAAWPMPDREDGFYAAWRAVAPHDGDVPGCDSTADVPERPENAIETVLAEYPRSEWGDVFEHHLAALPGWTGFIKQRTENADEWQSASPISLTDYLAVRLVLAEFLDAPIEPDADDAAPDDEVPLPELWLSAWEKSHRARLVGQLADPSEATDTGRPDAQLVFCIDTRSEVIRRHVETVGDYETHGYAGFFGVPMRHQAYDAEVAVDACPPIVDPEHRIRDRPTEDDARERYDRWTGVLKTGKTLLKDLKTNAATAFSLVESTGAGYGAALAARTLLPGRVSNLLDTPDEHEFVGPSVDYNPDSVHALREGLTHAEKVEYAQTAFELMGWEEFARLVVFTGHASETTNNPFDSSLDCGACAGNPGGPNARVLAAICNDDDVQADLRERGFDVPEDTVFLAAEHNTTTDEITLFDGDVPASHEADVEQLRADLGTAQERATAERTNGVSEAERRAGDWAETRPEWGLAGNASFVVGPRELTDGEHLDGRTFLHSYDWTTDPDGDALEAIMTGPLVVTQWINSQYYFATVDNAVYGSGSKVTHNPVGNVGVYQGNGGDLMTGLPLQSLYADADTPHHQPLRLTAVIHAPVEQVTEILRDNEQLAQLLDNGWLRLTVLDPEQDGAPVHYQGDFEWESPQAERTPVKQPAPVASGGAAD
ncbi:MAG: DUF2309 domain-containing protein [Halobacteriaceae archaeon]